MTERKKRRWVPLGLALTMALSLAACGSDDEGSDPGASEGETTTTVAEGGGEVDITAVDFGFSVPETLPAGETTFNFTNEGKEPHEFTLVPLTEEAPPVAELIELPRKEAEQYFAGAPEGTFAKPGKEGEPLTVDLQPGRYGYVCFVQSKANGNKPHAFLGMQGEITVE